MVNMPTPVSLLVVQDPLLGPWCFIFRTFLRISDVRNINVEECAECVNLLNTPGIHGGRTALFTPGITLSPTGNRAKGHRNPLQKARWYKDCQHPKRCVSLIKTVIPPFLVFLSLSAQTLGDIPMV